MKPWGWFAKFSAWFLVGVVVVVSLGVRRDVSWLMLVVHCVALVGVGNGMRKTLEPEPSGKRVEL